MKHATDNPTANLMLRCDSPQAIRIFRSEAAWLIAQGKVAPDSPIDGQPPASELIANLRARGNESFRAGRIDEAIDVYTEALAAAQSACLPLDISAPILSNRAQCFLKQEVGSRALADVDCVLRQQPKDQKCLHRRVRALLLLPGRLHEASEACSACADGPERKTLRAEILRALAESRGEFDEPALIREARADPDCRVSRTHADYFADHAIRIAAGCVAGRGIVATADLPADTLLMAAKAFCSTSLADGADGATQLLRSIDPYQRTVEDGDSAALASRAMLRLGRLPEAERAAFFSLSSGALPAGAGDAASLNPRRVRAILKHNAFERSSLATSEVWEACERVELAERLGRLPTADEWQEALDRERRIGSGLWILPSLFNHSCCPSARATAVGDILFVRTVRPIATGEEVFLSYIDGSLPLEERAAKIACNWGFVCACPRCSLPLALPQFAAMETEVAEVLAACNRLKMQAHNGDAPFERALPAGRADALLRAWASIEPGCQGPLASVLEALAGAAMRRRDWAAAVALSERQDAVRRAAGTQCDPHSLQRNAIFRAGCLIQAGDAAAARLALARARSLCGGWLKPPSGASFAAMCRTYCCVADANLRDRLEKLGRDADAAFKLRRAPSQPAGGGGARGSAAPADAPAACVLPAIPPLTTERNRPAAPPDPRGGGIGSGGGGGEAPPPLPAAAAMAVCGRCGALGCAAAPLRRCTGCGSAWYCSRACQREAWPGHRDACRLGCRAAPPPPPR
jgi:tetratricopeptide (TPR) repeat protein